jgi:sphinganine-1-phosphate aldolase
MESLIDSNTICLMGSYPNFPHGIIDPIAEIAKLGVKYNVGVHIDGCLGGFVAGFAKEHQDLFNIDRDGITSVSLDHHKFGLAPKGISNIFFKTQKLRHCMYFLNTEWCGGIYCTPSFTGSRSGFASAGAWFALTQNTKKGYKQNTKELMDATSEAASKLRKTSGV